MQNRIANPFRPKWDGQTKSKIHASDSVQNRPRIVAESEAESSTLTSPNTSHSTSLLVVAERIRTPAPKRLRAALPLAHQGGWPALFAY